MANQSPLFMSLMDHAPFAMIGWSIWLSLLQTIVFTMDIKKSDLKNQNFFLIEWRNRIFFYKKTKKRSWQSWQINECMFRRKSAATVVCKLPSIIITLTAYSNRAFIYHNNDYTRIMESLEAAYKYVKRRLSKVLKSQPLGSRGLNFLCGVVKCFCGLWTKLKNRTLAKHLQTQTQNWTSAWQNE